MAYNINTRCQIDASTTLGNLLTTFLNDGSRGSQSVQNYWNNSQRYAVGQQLTVKFRNTYAVKNITLQMPIFNISGPYTLSGITVELFLNNVVVFTQNNVSMTGGLNLAGCIDANINMNPLNADTLKITYGNPNVDGWVFLGEIIINCVDNNLTECLKYLEVKSEEIIRGSIQLMNTGIKAFPPQLGAGYNAFWLRDYAYMLEGSGTDAFYTQDLLDAAYMFTNSMRSDGAEVDTVQYNMNPIYTPGFGVGFGSNPVLDGACFYVDVIYQTYLITKNTKFLESVLNACEYALNFIPLGPNGIPYISPVGYDRAPYGFTDSVRKQGEQLFDGLLLVQAKKQMIIFYDLLGLSVKSRLMQKSLGTLIGKINSVLWDANTGLYRATTGQCSINHDVWGSAFAVRLNVPYPDMKTAICNYFDINYANLIQSGALRHLPAPTFWQVSTAAPGTYQNGAYWPCAIGLFVYCLDIVNPAKADQTVIDMVQYMQVNGIYEWYNGPILGVVNYTASTAWPIEGIKAMINRRAGKTIPDLPSCIY